MTQSTVNIGMVGHVDHGKTTLVKSLSGVWTDTHSEEIKRGISIRLGYADCVFRRCEHCKEPDCYTVDEICKQCGSKTKEIRTVSFVDAPGHETLMATMLSGSALMDGAMLVIAANEKCPQPQTKEHLMALNIIGIHNIVIIQNKIDLVSKERVLEHYNEIKNFVKGTIAENSPIIPISAQQNINIDALIMALEKYIPTPIYKNNQSPRMLIARSFDINKPGISINKLKGGVIGGSLISGMLRENDEIEIRPGLKITSEGITKWIPIKTRIIEIYAGKSKVNIASSGGLLAISTLLDPNLTKGDSLTGQVAGKPGTLPDIKYEFKINLNLLDRIVGSHIESSMIDIKTGDLLMLNIGTATTIGLVTSSRKNIAEVKLKRPVCVDSGSRIAISRRFDSRWRLIGTGIISY